MSADIEHAYQLLDEIRRNLSSSVSKTYQRRYGEIFITEQGEIVLSCTFCDSKNADCNPFLAHILEHHYAYKAKETQQNEKRASISSKSNKEHMSTCEITISESDEQPPEKESLTQQHNTTESTTGTSDSSRAGTPELPPVKKPRIYKRSNRLFRCKACDYTSREVKHMRVHCRRHTGERPFACEHCPKKFITSFELTTHTLRHKGYRPFVCAYCGQSFFTNGTLKLHERRHSDYRAYKCELCEKRFYDSTRYNAHVQVHKGERNHVCNTCGRAYSTKRTLRDHIKVHINARQYACNLCEMAFNLKDTLQTHIKRKHKVITNSESKSTNE